MAAQKEVRAWFFDPNIAKKISAGEINALQGRFKGNLEIVFPEEESYNMHIYATNAKDAKELGKWMRVFAPLASSKRMYV